MQKTSGLAIIAIALLHSLIGLIAPGLIGFEGIWQDIAASGVFDAAKPDTLSIWGYYWFLLAGFFLMLCGGLCYWVEHSLDRVLPAFVGWGLLSDRTLWHRVRSGYRLLVGAAYSHQYPGSLAG